MKIKDYYNKLIQVKEGNVELDELQPYNDNGAALIEDLNSGSKVAIWRLLFWIVATISWLQNEAFSVLKKEISEDIANGYHGSLRYYHTRALNFQFGHQLEYNGKQYVYLNVDESSKIIKRCAVSMHQGVMRFKVTKETNGVLEPLTAPELAAIKDFLFEILYPGTEYEVISSEADLLKLDIKVYVNPQIIDPSSGEHVVTGEPVFEDASNSFLKNLPFSGRMNIQKYIDHIQAVEGVEDIEIIGTSYKYGSLNWLPFTREVEPFSGYMDLDLANSNINYHEYL